ncbi:MAG: HD domain-containing protein [Planctomycetes bacterium]|nr:HD domain-containing protein [Planctomycetota bacterium]
MEELSRELNEANERLKLTSRGRLEALMRMGDALATVQNLDLLLARILDEAKSLTNAEAGTIYVCEGDELRFAAAQNSRLAPDRSDALAGRVPSDHLPIGMRSIAGAAAIGGTLIAVTDAYNLPDDVPYAFDRRFDEDDQMLLRHFAGIASVSMERARLRRSIITRMIRGVELWVTHATANAVHPEEIARGTDHLRIAAMLHDIGKLGISDMILKKPARLEPEEMNQVRQHAILGIKLFVDVQTRFDRHARDGHSTLRADRGDRGRLRGADLASQLQEGVDHRGGAGRHPDRVRAPLRSRPVRTFPRSRPKVRREVAA